MDEVPREIYVMNRIHTIVTLVQFTAPHSPWAEFTNNSIQDACKNTGSEL